MRMFRTRDVTLTAKPRSHGIKLVLNGYVRHIRKFLASRGGGVRSPFDGSLTCMKPYLLTCSVQQQENTSMDGPEVITRYPRVEDVRGSFWD